MIRKLLFFVLAIVVSVYAESYLSLYYPLGTPLQTSTGSARSMGGSGTGVKESFFGISLNPANIANHEKSVFSSVASFDVNSYNDTERHYFYNFSPSMLSLIVPVGAFGNLGFSFANRTKGDLNFRSVEELQSPVPESTDTLYTGLIRKGGMNEWQAGWGYHLANDIQIGFTYKRLYYSMQTDRVYGFASGESSYYHEIQRNTEETFAANGVKVGAILPWGDLTLGAAGEYVFVNESDIVNSNKLREDTISNKSNVTIHPPPSATIGLSYQLTSEWLLAADIHTVLWDRFISDDNSSLRRTYSTSAGARYIPSPEYIFATDYWRTIQYSTGLRYEQMPVEGASEVTFTLGTALPIQQSSALLNIGFEYSRRRDTNLNDFTEDVFRLVIGLNGSQKWFQNR
ncbi:hypothetical protein QA601_04785 [Chitinispirillales bacterium ANBcel5]|uniref:hypothetical protein n=1 Tax=Cellulosispirillum alkaliphilum TaxID=3039283 RepID=UPI002A54F2E0|nr:hypothetical protein [Chitinispirillales bacterium ANBcel5]